MTNLHKLYQKQVEAWKERFNNRVVSTELQIDRGKYLAVVREWKEIEPDLLSSRHKDTIELIEAEIERKRGMRKKDETEISFAPFEEGELEIIGYNQCLDEDIAYLEEQLKLIKNEQ